jgi:peptidoglycan/LPS O-acetylase OafA/YrhL
MRTDRLLHLGCGLLALSLLLTLALSGTQPEDPAALALVSWLGSLLLVLGAGMLVGHLVVRALTPPQTIEEVVRDWYDES